MQTRFGHTAVSFAMTCCVAVFLFAQKPPSDPTITIAGVPSDPIPIGTCTSSTFGYVLLDGKRIGFSDAAFGKAVIAALRQGYVLTIYPPTKRGIFISQACHGAGK